MRIGGQMARAAFVVLLVAGASPAFAQVEVITRMLGNALGLSNDQEEPIQYRERAPLVVPPGTTGGQLRPPAPAGAERGNWPRDPDVEARRRAAADRQRPIINPSDRDLLRPMTTDEIRAGRQAGREVTRNPQALVRDNEMANTLGGVQALRQMDARTAAEDNGLRPGFEPRREYLTDPPSGLRMPAGNAPIRVTRDKAEAQQVTGSPYEIFQEGPRSR
jgi:hypothetical protein